MRLNCSLGGIVLYNERKRRIKKSDTNRRTEIWKHPQPKFVEDNEEILREKKPFILEIICLARMVFDWPTMARAFICFSISFSISRSIFFFLEFFSLCLYVYMNCSWIILWIILFSTNITSLTHMPRSSILWTFLPFVLIHKANNICSRTMTI